MYRQIAVWSTLIILLAFNLIACDTVIVRPVAPITPVAIQPMQTLPMDGITTTPLVVSPIMTATLEPTTVFDPSKTPVPTPTHTISPTALPAATTVAEPMLRINTRQALVGMEVILTGQLWPPHNRLRLIFGIPKTDIAELLSSVVTDSTGNFQTKLTLPTAFDHAPLRPGLYAIAAQTSDGRQGADVEVNLIVPVLHGTPGGR